MSTMTYYEFGCQIKSDAQRMRIHSASIHCTHFKTYKLCPLPFSFKVLESVLSFFFIASNAFHNLPRRLPREKRLGRKYSLAVLVSRLARPAGPLRWADDTRTPRKWLPTRNTNKLQLFSCGVKKHATVDIKVFTSDRRPSHKSNWLIYKYMWVQVYVCGVLVF